MDTSFALSPSKPPADSPQSVAPPALFRPIAVLLLWVAPLAILLFLNFQGYSLVEGNMTPVQRHEAVVAGEFGALDFLLAWVAYAISWRWSKLSSLSARRFNILGVVIIAIQVAYLWSAVYQLDKFFPRSLGAWIYSEERFLFNQFAFVMLPLGFGVLLLASFLPVRKFGAALALNLVLVIACPVALYLVVQALSLVKSFEKFTGVVLATGLVVAGVVMFVGIVRGLLMGMRALQATDRAVGERIAIVIFAFVLPVAGLILNRWIPFPVDLQSWEVYALVAANAAILLFSSFRRTRSATFCYGLLCASFPFSLYFFIVFLPFTPLSILAVIFMGAGFLVLAPIILFVLHGQLLARSRAVLRELGVPSAKVTFLGLACGALLPGFFTVRGLADKLALNAALDYIYSPSVTTGDLHYTTSVANLTRALQNHRSYKNGIYYPLLSDYYSWLVFNNLILPDDKLARLEETFVGSKGSTKNTDPIHGRMGRVFNGSSVRLQTLMPPALRTAQTVKVSQLQIRADATRPNSRTLSLTLENTVPGPAEYVEKLPLPPGAFVNGFRLSVSGTSVPGQIFEKKTALWIYTMIRDQERRDPGILYYTTPTELELRAYPVTQDKPMTVEIEYLFSGPVPNLAFSASSSDPAEWLTAVGQQLSPEVFQDDQGTLLSGSLAAVNLPHATRETYLHLIIDRSDAAGWEGDLSGELRRLKEKFPSSRQVRITEANFDVVDRIPALTAIDEVIADSAKSAASRKLPLQGGLALDLALAHALREHRDLDLDAGALSANVAPPPRPIFIVLRGNHAAFPSEFEMAERWSDALDPLEIYERVGQEELVARRSPANIDSPLIRIGKSIRPVVADRSLRFASNKIDGAPMYWSEHDAQWRPLEGVGQTVPSKDWSRAVGLQFQEQDYARSPGGAQTNLKALVAASRELGILLTNTSYIVVENSAQWRMLQLSERQKLGQNAALEFLETPAPPSLYVALSFGAWLGVRRLRSRRRVQPKIG